jgi:hypothetical protein
MKRGVRRRSAEAVPVPAVDPAMFRGVLGDITRAIEPGTEADTAGIYGSLLSMTGVLVGRRPHIMIGNSRHPLLPWSLLIGPTNTGRKGDATNSARRVAEAACPELKSISVTGLSTGEGIISRIRDPATVGKEKVGTDDKRLFILESEWARVMEVCRREATTLSPVLREAWDGNALSVLTKVPYYASWSHIALTAHITPEEFLEKLNKADMSGGLYNRFLPLYVKRRKLLSRPPGLTSEELKLWSGKLAEAITKAKKLNQLTLSEDAEKYWDEEVYPELTNAAEENAIEAAFIQRAPAYCWRIAALLSALDGNAHTTRDDLDSAFALIRYSAASARYALSTAKRDPNLDKLQRAVDESATGLDGKAVSGLFSRHLSAEQLKELSDELCSDPAYQLTKVSTDGPPRKILRRVSALLQAN